VDGDVTVQYNHALLDVDGFAALSVVGSKLLVAFNDSLASLSGLDGLTAALLIELKGNDALPLIAGFNNLVIPVAFLDINYNDALTDISGFNGLAEISYSVHINGNGALTDLSGFAALQTVGSILQIGNNPQLCLSIVEAFIGGLVIGNLVEPTGNDDGC
jgi:hypothetical protein